jgi:SAM-dependent methyltransferase
VVNREHLELCSSPEWRVLLRDEILPYALSNAYLGDEVVEIGPGPGLATELLRETTRGVTAVQLDSDFANALASRFASTNVDVVHADSTNMPLEDGRFTGAVALTMLHHMPTTQLQDRLFSESRGSCSRTGSSSLPTAWLQPSSPRSTLAIRTTRSILARWPFASSEPASSTSTCA